MKVYDVVGDDKYLQIDDFENFFNVKNKDGKLVYNLNETLYIGNLDQNLKSYKLQHDMHWPTISYMLYKTTRLAWLLMKVNGIDITNVFDKKRAGDTIMYLDHKAVSMIIAQISDFED